MRTVRSYQKLVNEIINLQIPFRVEIMGYINYDEVVYPLFAFKRLSKIAKKNVVILGGHHGDEYFAVHTLMKWIQQFQAESYPEFNFYVFPICNPFGYSKNSRTNGAKQDTNNDVNFVKDSKVKELSILYEQFPVNVDLVLDVHGDTEKEQVYCYEHKSENLPSIAEKVLVENDTVIPYLRQKTIYKCPVNNGVIAPLKEDIGIEGVMERLGVEYTMTLELPGKYDGQKRMVGGVAIIDSILRHFKGVK
jgi:predicted deacylase